MAAVPDELAPGLWRWTARHPEWHPGDFGSEVASFAAVAGDAGASGGDALLLVDPLLPAEPEPVLELLDGLVAGRVAILVTIPYHVRSAEWLWLRWRERADVTIHGHPAAAKRLDAARGAFQVLGPDAEGPAGVRAFAIGRPRRYEQPVLLPAHRALAFGDAIVTVDGRLRMWADQRVDERRAAWYRDRFAPTLEPLLGLGAERILVTHGEPVLEGGTEALAAALQAPPWYHRG
jgi:hypothetical protein